MTKTSIAVVVVILVLLVGGGIWLFTRPNSTPSATNTTTDQSANSTLSPDNNTATNSTTTTPPSGTVVLKTSTNAALGTFLTDTNGMTLYVYAKDTPGVSNCTGTCASTWHPYTTTIADGLLGATGISGQISTIARTDGTMQLTYNNEPLYTYTKDVKAGDTNGQNYQNLWSVVAP